MLKLYFSKSIKPFYLITLMLFALSSMGQVPVAKFGASKRVLEVYEGISLYDSSSNTPIQWEWNVYDSVTYKDDPFDPISDLSGGWVSYDKGTSNSSKNPFITFYRTGIYTVTLRSRNTTGWSAKKVINKYIKVIEPTSYFLGFGSYGPMNNNVVGSDYGSIIDDGGQNSNYSNNQGYSTRSFIHIHPCQAKTITLKMTQLKFGDTSDVLSVYDDDHENNSKLLAYWTKGHTSGKSVTALSGHMYIVYKSNGSGVDSGYYGTYTSVLDTTAPTYNIDFYTDSIFNSAPFHFKDLTTGFPGVPVNKWTIDGNTVGAGLKDGLHTRFFSDGAYQVCLNYKGCDEDTTLCKSVTVYTPNSPSNINFSKTNILNNANKYALTPLTNKSSNFEWTISPTNYILLNPPSKPSRYKPGSIIYNDCPGDTLPTPLIWFLDSTCYTITLKAWSNIDSSNTDASFTKSNYICATDFRKDFGIFGKVYIDQNNDCSMGGSEPYLSNIPVKLYDSANKIMGLTYTGQNGLYMFEKSVGKYRVEVDLNYVPLKTTCPTGIDTNVNLVKGTLANGFNFATVCGNADIGVQNVLPFKAVFPGRTHYLNIKAGFLNKDILANCNNTTDSAIIKVTVSGKVKYQGMYNSPSPNSISGSTYTWRIKDLMKFGNNLGMYFKVDTNAKSNDTIVVHVEITPFGADKDTTNNKYKYIYKVGNSYDPNIKETYPENVLPKYNDWFYYTIHFQNTGTAPAYNIRLEDTIDSQLDYETMQLIDYSHPNRMAFNKNVLKFYFDDIMLPDSFTNSKGSIGYVQYRIKPKANLPLGTKIHNTAFIYFDYNSPVITNTTTNEYTEPKGNSVKAIATDAFVIYPNPSHGIYKLQLKNNSSTKLTILNSQGQVIKTIEINGHTLIDLSQYSNGIYFVRIEQGDQIYHAKLLKE